MLDSHHRIRRSATVVLAILVTVSSSTVVFVAPRPVPLVAPGLSVIYTTSAVVKDPVISSTRGVVAFSSNLSGTFQIWTINPSGQHLSRLTYLPGDSEFPRFDPTGNFIAFYHSDATSRTILLMGPDGSNLKSVPNASDADGVFSWSPTGESIAYEQTSGRQSRVDVIDIRNGQVTFEANGSSPVWNDDGGSLAFVEGHQGVWALQIANLTSSIVRSVFKGPNMPRYPVFYENSGSLVFLGSIGGRLTIGAVRVIDGSIRDLLQPPPAGILNQQWTLPLDQNCGPIPIPGGKVIVFAAKTTPGLSDFFQVIPETYVTVSEGGPDSAYPGTFIGRLTSENYTALGAPSWWTDGSLLVFAGRNVAGAYDLAVFPYTPPELQSSYGGR